MPLSLSYISKYKVPDEKQKFCFTAMNGTPASEKRGRSCARGINEQLFHKAKYATRKLSDEMQKFSPISPLPFAVSLSFTPILKEAFWHNCCTNTL